jgi:hypothetical protein
VPGELLLTICSGPQQLGTDVEVLVDVEVEVLVDDEVLVEVEVLVVVLVVAGVGQAPGAAVREPGGALRFTWSFSFLFGGLVVEFGAKAAQYFIVPDVTTTPTRLVRVLPAGGLSVMAVFLQTAFTTFFLMRTTLQGSAGEPAPTYLNCPDPRSFHGGDPGGRLYVLFPNEISSVSKNWTLAPARFGTSAPVGRGKSKPVGGLQTNLARFEAGFEGVLTSRICSPLGRRRRTRVRYTM